MQFCGFFGKKIFFDLDFLAGVGAQAIFCGAVGVLFLWLDLHQGKILHLCWSTYVASS